MYIMKKYIKRYACIGLVFFAFISIFIQITYADTSGSVLKKGMSGSEVTALQNNLKNLGYFKQKPTGYFGAITEVAVVQFQKEHGISPDGKVATDTYNKIDIFLKKSILKKGMTGKDVSTLQSDLKKLNFFNQTPTGYFGDITETAVKTFQKQYSLDIKGVVDILTYVKIDYLLNKSTGIKVVIDPGHGGIDKGTSKGNVVESEITLDISKKLKDCLEGDGYNIVLTRDKDIALNSLSGKSGSRELRDLDARTNIINKNQAKLFVSIHVNSCPESPSTSGSIVFYNDKLAQSKILAQNIQKALNNISTSGFKRQSNNSQKEKDFYVLKNSNIPGVLVETAFITNSNELKLLATNAFKDKLAKAVALGIENTDFK
jgi:N-acetylmuramoyl-L-alanine amidase